MDTGDELASAVTAAQQGLEWGWTQLYRVLAPAVAGYLRAQEAREPEDLTGEVFVQAVRSIQGFSGDAAAFRSWIFCIAHNKLVDDSRYRKRRPVEVMAGPGRDLVHPDRVEDLVLNNLARARVRRVILKLTDDQRDVLLLRILGGLTIDEVARTLGKQPSAVKALQRRGLAIIKRDFPAPAYPFKADRRLPALG
ncbi:MAG: sigma-70 family RNA polymerase sigma factor [Actinomycetota bacterium]